MNIGPNQLCLRGVKGLCNYPVVRVKFFPKRVQVNADEQDKKTLGFIGHSAPLKTVLISL